MIFSRSKLPQSTHTLRLAVAAISAAVILPCSRDLSGQEKAPNASPVSPASSDESVGPSSKHQSEDSQSDGATELQKQTTGGSPEADLFANIKQIETRCSELKREVASLEAQLDQPGRTAEEILQLDANLANARREFAEHEKIAIHHYTAKRLQTLFNPVPRLSDLPCTGDKFPEMARTGSGLVIAGSEKGNVRNILATRSDNNNFGKIVWGYSFRSESQINQIEAVANLLEITLTNGTKIQLDTESGRLIEESGAAQEKRNQ